MEKINNYWVDENRNKWSAYDNTEKQAQEKVNLLQIVLIVGIVVIVKII